jgi:eukaryotic-like serine/threonine-protein kinase
MEHAVALRQDHLVLGRYRPLRPLGSGGSGSVWLVCDEHSGRDVALKVVPREGKAGSRAEREVEAATRLRHPRCLRALALERDDRHVYVAYEYVPGKTLRQALRQGALDDASAVEAAAQVLEALAHAHGKGVVHRDVKPANVMLEDAEDVSVRVLDFGLAQLEEADTLTAVGDVPGTLAYIAPERLAGREANGAADVWSVGVLLWEVLAGKHPFSSFSPLETARRVNEGAPPLAALRPDLPRRLTQSVDAMLAPAPARRPAAKQASVWLRSAWTERTERPRPAVSRSRVAERAGPALLAATYAGTATWLLPFFPSGWSFLLAGLTALVALATPGGGLALALAMPILPLGNLSLGLAVLYAVFAVGWLAAFARHTRHGLLFLLGPALAPAHALVLVPVLVRKVDGLVRRGLIAAASLPAALVVAGLTHDALPFTEDPAAGLEIAGFASPSATFDALVEFLSARPVLWIEGVVLIAAAAAAPYATRRQAWGVGAWGACFAVAALVAPLGSVSVFPTLVWIAVGTALLAVPLLGMRR